jgi:hypothetical protein
MTALRAFIPRLEVAFEANSPIRPPTQPPKHANSACEAHRAWIEEQIQLGRNAQAIYQDLVEQFDRVVAVAAHLLSEARHRYCKPDFRQMNRT